MADVINKTIGDEAGVNKFSKQLDLSSYRDYEANAMAISASNEMIKSALDI